VIAPVLLRSRPVVVEAVQVTEDNLADVAEWSGGIYGDDHVWLLTDLAQPAVARVGDWVLKGPFGEFYPAADKVIFAKYDSVLPVVSE
jgi:hypothetical protein